MVCHCFHACPEDETIGFVLFLPAMPCPCLRSHPSLTQMSLCFVIVLARRLSPVEFEKLDMPPLPVITIIVVLMKLRPIAALLGSELRVLPGRQVRVRKFLQQHAMPALLRCCCFMLHAAATLPCCCCATHEGTCFTQAAM